MSSYQKIKAHVFNQLSVKQNQDGGLETKDIDMALDNAKKLVLIPDATKLIFGPNLECPTEEDWVRMKRELETHFDVKMDFGQLIQGEEQRQRDTTWWSSVEKQRTEKFYWDRYKIYISSSFPPEVIKALDTDTDVIMDNIENIAVNKFSRYGMVVGHVQSGKTANYSALVCKAADAGYKFIVVIAGGINNLRNQTQVRLNESFIGQDKGVQVGAGIGNTRKEKLPYSLTTTDTDFNKHDADKNSQGLNFDNISVPILIVIKKNTNTLTNVISWLENQYRNQIAKHAMLLIDDESDYASINTREKEDPAVINKKIRKLLSLFHKSAYVAYTATPYANIFIDHKAWKEDIGRDLFPKDFIYALDAPSNYFGARKVFLANGNRYLIPIEDYLDDIPPKHKKEFELPTIPKSLYEAVRIFILNVAIRSLRGQQDKHNSMLIHVTRFTNVHKKVAIHIEEYISEIRKEVNSYGKLQDAEKISGIIKDLRDTYNLHHSEVETNWLNVKNRLCSLIDTILVREVHQNTKIPLVYRKDIPTNAVVIGGTSLSRGFTLEGLNVSYFLRNTVFYDTLMQMGRWFGYRTGYEDLCRVFIPPSMIDNFGHIIEATEDLIRDFKIMAEAKRTPYDFGLAVRQHPDSVLQVTARNKQKNVKTFVFNMKLDGKAKETSWLPESIDARKENLCTLERMLVELGTLSSKKIGKDYLWRNVNKNIVLKFLNDFRLFQNDPLGITARMPIGFVRKYVEKRDTCWDVALYSGEGKEYNIGPLKIFKEIRKAKIENGHYEITHRQVSSGNAESIALPAEARKRLGSKRNEIRNELKNPLLMLHILETQEDSALAAFGVSFPGNVLSNDETINLTINTVYYQNLLEDEDSDD
jgi:hypothetical protein